MTVFVMGRFEVGREGIWIHKLNKYGKCLIYARRCANPGGTMSRNMDTVLVPQVYS